MLPAAVVRSPLRLAPPRAAARRRAAAAAVITMRDRSKNRKPTQRGRYLSTEAIQAVQSLKRAALRGSPSAAAAAVPVEPKLRRLLKADMVSVFRELAAQGEALLALQVHPSYACDCHRAQCIYYNSVIQFVSESYQMSIRFERNIKWRQLLQVVK